MELGYDHCSSLLLFFLILLLIGSSSEHAQRRSCPATCGVTLISYPFKLHNQSRSCGRPDFELICRQNTTILKLSSTTELHVSEIDYKRRSLLVSDPDHCLHKHLLHLDLSSSPFYMPPETLRESTYFNCSQNITDPAGSASIPCLSGLGSQIYVVNSSRSMASMPPFCECVKTVSISTDSYLYFPIFKVYDYNNSSGEDRLYLTWDQRQPGRSKLSLNSILIIIGLIVGGGCTVAVIMAFYYRLNRKPTGKLKREDLKRVEKMLEGYESLRLARYSHASIKRMTQDFKQKIGSGGYGCVYRGKLRNEVPVAVKVLQTSKNNCSQDFINEIATIGRVHHVNVVRLLGFCSEGTKMALIYEFMTNESLEKFILYREGLARPWLGWRKLEEIAIGVAKGIEYLHNGCSQRILHLDIKPHNILLDENFNPKISDFGLAKICSRGRSKADMAGSSRGGTMGYIAPEIVSRTFGVVSYKSDVYSFGMLLLEMAGGRKKMESEDENFSQVCFPEWVYDEGVDREKVEIDLELVMEKEEKEIERKLTVIGLWCIQWNPNDRPSMKKVIEMLQGDGGSLQRPPRPYFQFHGLTSEFFR